LLTNNNNTGHIKNNITIRNNNNSDINNSITINSNNKDNNVSNNKHNSSNINNTNTNGIIRYAIIINDNHTKHNTIYDNTIQHKKKTRKKGTVNKNAWDIITPTNILIQTTTTIYSSSSTTSTP